MNVFIGKNQTWLEAELEKAQAEYAAGKVTVGVSAGDASTNKQQAMSLERRIQMLLKALHKLDPETYPAEDVIPNRQTKVAF